MKVEKIRYLRVEQNESAPPSSHTYPPTTHMRAELESELEAELESELEAELESELGFLRARARESTFTH